MSDLIDGPGPPASAIRPSPIAETIAISRVSTAGSESTSTRTGSESGPPADTKNAPMIDKEPDYRFTAMRRNDPLPRSLMVQLTVV